MKKIFAIIILTVFILAGCANTQIHLTDDGVLKAGKAAGTFVLATYPDVAKDALPYAQAFLDSAQKGTIDSVAITKAVDTLLTQCKADKNLKAYIDVGLALIDVEITVGTVNPKLVDLLNGFVQGITPAPMSMIEIIDMKVKHDLIAIKQSMKGFGG